MSLNSSVVKEKNHRDLKSYYSKSSIDLRISSGMNDMEKYNKKESLMSLVFIHQDNLSEYSIPTPLLLPLPNN